MRTTVTLDADSYQLIKKRMREKGLSFKEAINEAIRDSFGGRKQTGFKTPTADLGIPAINLDRALQVAAEIENEELVRKHRTGK